MWGVGWLQCGSWAMVGWVAGVRRVTAGGTELEKLGPASVRIHALVCCQSTVKRVGEGRILTLSGSC